MWCQIRMCRIGWQVCTRIYLSELKKAGVTQIFHAGDICIPSVLEALTTVAPVIAVRGNRDWLFAGKLPWRRDFEMAGVKFAMMHGMGNWRKYLEYKLRHAFNGYVLKNYLPMMREAAPKADVIIFGHTHYPEIIREDGQLVFNPGSAGPGSAVRGAGRDGSRHLVYSKCCRMVRWRRKFGNWHRKPEGFPKRIKPSVVNYKKIHETLMLNLIDL